MLRSAFQKSCKVKLKLKHPVRPFLLLALMHLWQTLSFYFCFVLQLNFCIYFFIAILFFLATASSSFSFFPIKIRSRSSSVFDLNVCGLGKNNFYSFYWPSQTISCGTKAFNLKSESASFATVTILSCYFVFSLIRHLAQCIQEPFSVME